MKPGLIPASIALALAAAPVVSQAAVDESSPFVWQAPRGSDPDGVAVAGTGVVYVGDRRVIGDKMHSRILRIESRGKATVVATLPATGTSPLARAVTRLDLAAGWNGDVVATHATFDARHHGVYRIDSKNGRAARIPGSVRIVLPTGVALDRRGVTYISDGYTGTIWRSDKGAVKPWLRHAALRPAAAISPSFPLAGAGALVLRTANELFVANPSSGSIVRVAIDERGAASGVSVLAKDTRLLSISGLAVDRKGQLLASIQAARVLRTSPLLRVDAATGEMDPIASDPAAAAPRAIATSLLYGAHAFVVSGKPIGETGRETRGLSLQGVAAPVREVGGGKKAASPFTFRDASTDRIRSDGQGSYSGSVDSTAWASIEMKTGRRSLSFDFTQRTVCGNDPIAPCASPFASSNDVGTSTNVTLTASYLAIQSPVGVMLEFDASGERWRVVSEMSVQRLDTNNDQVIDRYVLTPTTLDARLYLMRYEQLQTGGGRARDRRYYWVSRWAADYAMPWQVVIDVK
jgi:hypothetical protein